MKILSKIGRINTGVVFLLICFSVTVNANGFNLKKMLLMPDELISGHEDLEGDCNNCHTNFDQSNQNPLCLDCHEEIAADINKNSSYHGLNTEIEGTHCRTCHTDHQGRDADVVQLDKESFRHELTNYPLEGKHQNLSCTQCHEGNDGFRLEKYECNDCHKLQDPHKGELGTECKDCHTTSSWRKTDFNHDETDFVLEHKHSEVGCTSCHFNNNYENAPKLCVDCHTNEDIHQNRFGSECEQCHSSVGWDESSFDHNQESDFKLKNRHQKVACKLCHKQSQTKKIQPENCNSCHASDDIHAGRNGTECESCHSEKGWADTLFDHDRETNFVLKGKHKQLICESCHHTEMGTRSTSRVCYDCHKNDDSHANSLGKNCGQCHSESKWNKSVIFSHETTEFPLLGMHRSLDCGECHLSGEFKEVKGTCIGCHSQDDAHNSSLGKECGTCHNPNDWGYWLFDHDKQTEFSLKGAHNNLSCNLCHHDDLPNPEKPPLKCSSCHRDDDIHRGSFGGQDCDQCHSEKSFGSSR